LRSFFGNTSEGVYVSRYAVSRRPVAVTSAHRVGGQDYCLKYSNGMEPLSIGDQCTLLMLDCLPGRSLHVKARTPGLHPTAGYDSHSSSNHQEVSWCGSSFVRPLNSRPRLTLFAVVPVR
jgi:hypothetical protein